MVTSLEDRGNRARMLCIDKGEALALQAFAHFDLLRDSCLINPARSLCRMGVSVETGARYRPTVRRGIPGRGRAKCPLKVVYANPDPRSITLNLVSENAPKPLSGDSRYGTGEMRTELLQAHWRRRLLYSKPPTHDVQ